VAAEFEMEAKLVVVGGKAQATEFPLQLPAVVGRSRTADLVLGHPLVSRQHCELYETDGRLMVRDLGSLNGTFIGDTRIQDAAILSPGGLLTIGSVTFKAVYEGPAEELSLPELPGEDATDSVENTLGADGLAALENARPKNTAHEDTTRDDTDSMTEEAPPSRPKGGSPSVDKPSSDEDLDDFFNSL
jgi:pSer/pThr/pTyr-binding forkhead associated (FHA) protein